MNLDRNLRDRLEEFFGDVVGPKAYAMDMRKFMYEVIGMTLAIDENRWDVDIDVIRNGFYSLTELCEILDPQLTRED